MSERVLAVDMPPVNHRVVVLWTGSDYAVRPPYVIVLDGERIQLRNLTGLAWRVLLPQPGPLVGVPGPTADLFYIDIELGEFERGAYPYQVYLSDDRARTFAKGESAPHVIID